MLKAILLTLMGLIVAPIFWAVQKLGVVKAPPKLTAPFEALNLHLFKSGVSAVGEMQHLTINNAKEVAAFRLGFDPTKFYVVTVTLSDDEAAASLVEGEARNAPQFTGVSRNGAFVMACTFSPANSDLERQFATAFMSYKHGI
jgi:hypothetical protein